MSNIPKSRTLFKQTKATIQKITNSGGVTYEVGQKFRLNDSEQVGKIDKIVAPIYNNIYGEYRIRIVNQVGISLGDFDIEFASNYVSPI